MLDRPLEKGYFLSLGAFILQKLSVLKREGVQCYIVAAGYPNQITTRMSQVSVKINHDSGNRPNSTKLADCRRRHALLLEHRHTHARGKRQRRRRRQTDRHSLACPVRLSVDGRLDSDPIIPLSPPLSLSLCHVQRRVCERRSSSA